MEKELNIIYNQEGDLISILTNFQEDLDLFEIQEISTIILDLINSIIDKVRKNIAIEEIGERTPEEIEDDEQEEIIKKMNQKTADFVGSLIYDIVNFVNNKDKEEPQRFDYSLAVYDTDKENKCKEIYETYHYGNLQEHEKLLSCYAFYKDFVDELLNKDNSKEQVKLLLKRVSSVMLVNIYKYIESQNKQDE